MSVPKLYIMRVEETLLRILLLLVQRFWFKLLELGPVFVDLYRLISLQFVEITHECALCLFSRMSCILLGWKVMAASPKVRCLEISRSNKPTSPAMSLPGLYQDLCDIRNSPLPSWHPSYHSIDHSITWMHFQSQTILRSNARVFHDRCNSQWTLIWKVLVLFTLNRYFFVYLSNETIEIDPFLLIALYFMIFW